MPRRNSHVRPTSSTARTCCSTPCSSSTRPPSLLISLLLERWLESLQGRRGNDPANEERHREPPDLTPPTQCGEKYSQASVDSNRYVSKTHAPQLPRLS